MIKGISASNGIAIAKAYKIEEFKLDITRKTIIDSEKEIKKLEEAITHATEDLKIIKANALKAMGTEKADIFEAHFLVANDPEFIGQVKEKIMNEKVNADFALKEVRDMFVILFQNMDNEYMRERSSDIKDVTNRILAKLLGVHLNDPPLINEEVIIISNDLTPSETSQMNKKYVKGFITVSGGRTSHSAIMARSLEIPAVVGAKTSMEEINDGDLLILDALKGEIIVNPTNELINDYHEVRLNYEKKQESLKTLKNKPSVTKDGVLVALGANIGTPKDLKAVREHGAEGIGLFRTEFLYMGKDRFPTEDEQYESYKTVLEGMEGKPVVVRTLDIGGDKELTYLNMPEEMNPFLGYRAIRLCLDRKDIFRVQLRALLRASVHGQLRIMFPMIATIDEFNEAKGYLLEVKQELITEGIKVSDAIEIGMMVEIPSAALLADQFAKVVDFFSIGTNDLIQYTFAADRMNEHVAYLYQPYNPSLLRLIKMVIDAAHKEQKWVGMCGEMAGDEIAIPLLLGFGLDEFSMSATSVLNTRYLIEHLSQKEMQAVALEALNKRNVNEVIELVRSKVKF